MIVTGHKTARFAMTQHGVQFFCCGEARTKKLYSVCSVIINT